MRAIALAILIGSVMIDMALRKENVDSRNIDFQDPATGLLAALFAAFVICLIGGW